MSCAALLAEIVNARSVDGRTTRTVAPLPSSLPTSIVVILDRTFADANAKAGAFPFAMVVGVNCTGIWLLKIRRTPLLALLPRSSFFSARSPFAQTVARFSSGRLYKGRPTHYDPKIISRMSQKDAALAPQASVLLCNADGPSPAGVPRLTGTVAFPDCHGWH